MLVNAQLVGNNGKSYKSDYTEGTGKTLYFSDMKGVTLYAFSPDSLILINAQKPTFPTILHGLFMKQTKL